MIYLSSSIVLTPAVYTSLANPVFGWQNLVTVGGIAADEEDADYPATNLANPQTSSLWKSGSTNDQDLDFTLTLTDEVDYVGIARHNFGTGHIRATIFGLTDEPGAEEVQLGQFTPRDDSPILAVFTAGYYSTIRIYLEPDAVEPQAAVIYIGKLLIMPRSTPNGFTHLKDGLQRENVVGIAENGDFLGDITISERLVTEVPFQFLEGDWYRETMRPFVQSGDPFFFAWSPSLLPNEAGFCKLTNVPQGRVNQWGGQVDVTLPLVGVAL